MAKTSVQICIYQASFAQAGAIARQVGRYVVWGCPGRVLVVSRPPPEQSRGPPGKVPGVSLVVLGVPG